MELLINQQLTQINAGLVGRNSCRKNLATRGGGKNIASKALSKRRTGKRRFG
jgi:hypothetical protein